MLSYKDYFARKLLPDYYRVEDSYKDQNGKGFLERYLEIFGQELDDYTASSITALEKLANPLIVGDSKFLEYYAFKNGDVDITSINADEAVYRNFLTYILSIYKIKGTLKSFKAILAIISITEVTLNPRPINAGVYDADPISTYDSGLLYDDSLCVTCFEYDIELTGTRALTAQLYNDIKNLIELVSPLHANLQNITYNEAELSESPITIEIDENGDLVYDNSSDPGLTLTLDENGDLIISGTSANDYFIDDEGNLIYIND